MPTSMKNFKISKKKKKKKKRGKKENWRGRKNINRKVMEK